MVERIVSTLRPARLARRREISDWPPPAIASRRARSMISLPLLVGELAEPRTAGHALVIVLHEAIDAAAQKAHALAAVEHQPAAHQAQLAPTRNGLRRNVELLGQLFDREHLLADVFGRHVGRVGQVFHEQAQIVQQVVALDFHLGGDFRADSR